MSTALVGMAILKVNYDKRGRDLLDNFLPLAADRLLHSGAQGVSIPDLRRAIADEYGIAIPGGVLKTIVKRCAKQGLVRLEAGIYTPAPAALAGYDLSEVRANMRRQHTALLDRGVEFARKSFGVAVNRGNFDAGLSAFIRENASPLLSTVVDGEPLAALDVADSKEDRYLIASFVSGLVDSDPEGFSFLSNIVKGAILAACLYFPEPGKLNQRLDSLVIYFDTTLLLRAVGASGPDLSLYAREVISLADHLGARLYCFRHTLEEIVGVLTACEAALKSGGNGSHGETTEYMLSAGWGRSDVVELKDNLEARLASLGVHVRDKPEHSVAWTLDEERLEEILNSEVRYRSHNALLRDLDSATAIYRIRRGREFRHLEQAKGIFVTHNTALVRAVRKYFKIEEDQRDTVPLCIPDYVLTTVLWLKEPLAAPELPEHAILADCFAAMRPDDALWRKYVDKIEQLRERESVTADDYVLLRQSLSVRSLIMYQTKEKVESFTEGTVEQVLAKARDNIASAALEEAAAERKLRTEAAAELRRSQEELNRLEAEKESQRELQQTELELIAHRIARIFVRFASALVFILALVGTILSVPWPGLAPPAFGFPLSLVVLVPLLAGSMLSLYGIFWGGNLSSLASRLQAITQRAVMRWMRRP